MVGPNAIKTDVEMFSGETPALTFTVKNAALATVDLTGAAISFVVHAAAVSGTLQFTKAVGAGVTIHDQVAQKGVFDVTLAAADTTNLLGTYYFEARMTI